MLLVACSSREQAVVSSKHDAAVVAHTADAGVADTATIDAVPGAGDPHWAKRFDFDGDHIPDEIASTFSGGAHCCYTLSVKLSQSGRVVAVPFELDGGYPGGLDLSQPGNFHVELGADGVASLWMRIASYGARSEAIPLAWVRDYGIHSHLIRVELRGGTLHVDNVMPDCAAALDQLAHFDVAAWDALPRCTLVELANHLDPSARSGLERKLGAAQHVVRTKHVIVDLDASRELVLAIDRDLVRADFDDTQPAASIVDVLGPPAARLPYTLWGFTHPSGQWVWPARGVVAYIDPNGTTVHHIGVFTPTDLASYRRDLAWP